MILQHGTYQHPDGEAVPLAFDRRTTVSPRGSVATEVTTMVAGIDVFAADYTALSARLAELEGFYAYGISQAGFRYSDGTQSKLWLATNPSLSLSAVNLIQKPSFTAQDSTEHVNHASMTAQWQLENLIPNADELLDFQETVTFDDEGATGQRYSPIVTDTGPVELAILAQRTPQVITQAGYAVGRTGYPLGYLNPLFSLPMTRRVVSYNGGRSRGLRAIGYRIDWIYVYVAGDPQSGLPRTI